MSDYYDFTLWAGSAITFLLQLYVLYLIIFECNREMKEYAYFLKLLMGYEILFNVLFGVVMSPSPMITTPGFETRGLARYLGTKFYLICSAFTCYAGVMIINAQLYCLVYRYLVVGSYKSLYRGFMSTWSKIGAQILGQICGIVASVFYYKLLCLEDCLFKFVDSEAGSPAIILDRFPVMVDTDLTMLLAFYKFAIVTFGFVQVTSFVLLYLILKTMRKDTTTLSRSTYRLYLQFTILLGAQLLTPFIFIFVPVAACVATILLRTRATEFQIKLGLLGLLFYGLANSILTVLFVTPFRMHAFRTFVYWWLKPFLKCLKLDNLIPLDQEKTTKVRTVANPRHNAPRYHTTLDVAQEMVVVPGQIILT